MFYKFWILPQSKFWEKTEGKNRENLHHSTISESKYENKCWKIETTT